MKKPPKKEEKPAKTQQGKKSGESGKSERTNSDSKQQQRTHVPQKTVTSQENILNLNGKCQLHFLLEILLKADLSEPVFTYMKNTFGVDETLNNLGFSLRSPFQKQKDSERESLHSAFVRLGIKSSQRVHDEPTERTLG